jgi:hypothetical protein
VRLEQEVAKPRSARTRTHGEKYAASAFTPHFGWQGDFPFRIRTATNLHSAT